MTQQPTLFDARPVAHFDGPAYVPEFDMERLTGQIRRVYECMKGGAWLTLNELADATGDPPASVSAQLRHLRKPAHGSFTVERRRRGEPKAGLWEYRLDAESGNRP